MTTSPATSADPGRTKRTELAAFLKARRARVTPEQAGLPPGARRRTPGLRREELAQLAGVGVTWYTWLEQGRTINVSVQVLDAVARVLRLGSAERWHLYRLAELPGTPSAPPSRVELPPSAVEVLDRLEPLPACVYSDRYDLLANNATFALMFPHLVRAEGVERNVVWQAAHSSPRVTPISDELLGRLVANLRVGYAQHVGEPEWEDFIADVTGANPVVAEHWRRQDVVASAPLDKVFRCPPVGDIHLHTMSYAIQGVGGCRMVVHLPESSADVDLIERLRELGGVVFDGPTAWALSRPSD